MNEGVPKSVKAERFPHPTMALEDVKTPEDFLNAVDFNELRAIFGTVIGKAGDQEQAVDLGTIRVARDETGPRIFGEEITAEIAATANRDTGQITLYADEIEKMIQKLHAHDPELDAPSVGYTVLHVVVHELTHMQSKKTPVTVEDGFERGTAGFVDFLRRSDERIITLGRALDEAMTEEVALEVLKEYLHRTGSRSLLAKPEIQNAALHFYVLDRVVLHGIADGLATSIGVPQEVAWRGMVHEYMNGNHSTYELLKALISELVESEVALPAILFQDPHVGAEQIAEIGDKFKDPGAFVRAAERVQYALDPNVVHNALGLS